MSSDLGTAQAPVPGAAQSPVGGNTAPAAMTPNDAGVQQRGRLMIGVGLWALEKGLAMYGSTSPEGKAVVEALGKLSKEFGKPAPDVGSAELALLQSMMKPVASGTGESPVAGAQDKAKQSLTGLGMSPAAPPQ